MSDITMTVTRAGTPFCGKAQSGMTLGGFGMSATYAMTHLVAVPTPKRPIAARNDAQGGESAWSPPV